MHSRTYVSVMCCKLPLAVCLSFEYTLQVARVCVLLASVQCAPAVRP